MEHIENTSDGVALADRLDADTLARLRRIAEEVTDAQS
jgi:hypothetical protein